MYCKNLGLTRGSWTRQCRQFLVPVTAARANATGARSALLAVAVRQTPMPSCAQVRTGLPELMPSVGVVSSLKKRSARNVLQQRVRILSYLNETVDASLKRDVVEACRKELQRNRLWPIVCCAGAVRANFNWSDQQGATCGVPRLGLLLQPEPTTIRASHASLVL